MLTSAMVLRFVPLPKSENPKHIEENANVFDFGISKSGMEALGALNSNTSVIWNPVGAP